MSDWEKDNMTHKISRRKLLAMIGATGVGAALASIGGVANGQSADVSFAGSCCNEYNVMDYGAVGDGTTDDTAAVQSAVNAAAAAGGGSVCFPYTATGYLLGDIVLTKPVKIAGKGRGVVLTAKAGTNKLFTIRSSQIEISGFLIYMHKTASGAVAFYLDTAAIALEHIYLRDLLVWNAYAVLRDAASSSNVIVNLHLTEVLCTYNRGVAIHLTDAFAYTYFKNVTVDNVPSGQLGIPVNFAGIVIENAQGIFFENCDINGGNGYAGGDGFVIKNCAAVYFDACMSDTLGGVGFVFENAWYVYLVAVVSSLCYRGGMTMTGCKFVNGTNVIMAGRSYLPDKVAGADGIKVKSSDQIMMTSLSIRFNSGNGITVDSSFVTTWSANHLFQNTGKGIQETGSNLSANLFLGCTFNSNGSNYQIVSPSSHVCNALLHSGSFQTNQAGPASL